MSADRPDRDGSGQIATTCHNRDGWCGLGSSWPAPTWRLVSDRHDPSTFSGLDVHYLKFTSAILSRDMTSGVTVETVGDDLGRVVITRRVVTIRREASLFLRPVTDRVYWT